MNLNNYCKILQGRYCRVMAKSAHVCDEDTDAATVRKVSKRGLHVSIHVHLDLEVRRRTTAGQGGGEGIDTASDTASDHTGSNTRLKTPKNELKGISRGSHSEDGKRK